MATLSTGKRKLIRKRKMRISIFLFLTGIITFPYVSLYFKRLLENRFVYEDIKITFLQGFVTLPKDKMQLEIYVILLSMLGLLIFMFLTSSSSSIGRTETVKITDNIEIPVPVGEGQHGTSRFLNEKEKSVIFHSVQYIPGKKFELIENEGLVLGMMKKNDKEIIKCIEDDINSIIIGATRSGKTRCMIIQSIWLRAATGKSMVVSDPKGELYLYTKEYLKNNGYNVIDFDLRQPLKSKHYNYLDGINKAVEENDIPRAIDYTWDLVSVLVGIPKGEPLWTNGESAVIAASILAVAIEAETEYKNLTNVYYFIANMCKVNEYGEMLITKYFEQLPEIHPAKGVFAVAEISPSRTRGSFFGSALATLRLFTNWNIADMTSRSDFDLKEIGKKKTALFIIIPDEKTTLYSLASLFVNQVYISLVETANKCGGRLPITVDFFLDEFGNFPAIPSFGSMLSVGAGRGIRFTNVLQDFQQLEKNYKDDYENIKGNSQIWIYLKTPNQKTLEELSKKTGTYTVQVNSANNSISGSKLSHSSYSDSANMQSRALLLPDEVGRIERPFSLVFYAGKFPSIFHAPDLSEYYANKDFGLGDKKANLKIIEERDNERPERKSEAIKLWGIWNTLNESEDEEEPESNTERVSFLE